MKHRILISFALIFLTMVGFSPELFHSAHGQTLWGSPSQIVGGSTDNSLLSTGLQASNGTMWLAWETNLYRGDSLYDIAYQTFTNGVWSAQQRLTSTSINQSPALVQLQNGTIILFWAYKPAASFLIYYERFNPNGWSSLNQVSSTSYNDTNPTAAVGRDGTLWLVWTRTNSTCNSPCTDQWKQLYYKTLKNGVWSPEAKLSTDNTQQNWVPSVIVGKDSLVRVAWSKGLGSQSNYQIYYKTYNSTTGLWSTEAKVETSSDSDEHPSLLQDRNGTVWLFWGRKHFTSSLAFYYFLEGQYSYNGGATWSAQQQLTNTATNVDSLMPNAVQNLYNKSIYLFYTTDANAADNVYALISSQISPVQDLQITSVSANMQKMYVGGFPATGQSAVVSITVTVFNWGDSSQVVTCGLSVSNSSYIYLGKKQNLAVPSGSAQLVFNWNTTGAKTAWYNVNATLTPVSGETSQNQYDGYYRTQRVVRLLPWGDIDQDGFVSIIDVNIVVFDYAATPGMATWNPLADYDNDGYISIIDVNYIVAHYGLTG